MKKQINNMGKQLFGALQQRKINKETQRKLTKIYKNIKDINIDEDRESRYCALWSRFGLKAPIKFLRCMVSISGIESHEYVPENIHYGMIEPVLNNRVYAHAYNDKNFFERYLSKYSEFLPETVLRGQYGSFYTHAFEPISDDRCNMLIDSLKGDSEYILKPSTETGGGENVCLLRKYSERFEFDGTTVTAREFLQILHGFNRGNFVLQKRIRQHNWFSNFNMSSLNTLRLYVYRSVTDEVVHPLHAYIRFGRPGSLVDSSSQGGLTCGVSLEGITNSYVVSKYGVVNADDQFIGKIGAAKVPNFSEFISLARDIAPHFPHHRLLGFDFSVDYNGGTRLLEVNNLYVGIINQQMNTGPLFRQYTQEVIDYCMHEPRSFSFHFYTDSGRL